MTVCYTTENQKNIPILAMTAERLEKWLENQSEHTGNWIEACGYSAKAGKICLVANVAGELEVVLLGVKSADDFWAFGALPKTLPKNTYHIDNADGYFSKEQLSRAQLAWGLGSYQFNAYRNNEALETCLFVEESNEASLFNLIDSIYLIRDLINTPADDMGPAELAEAVSAVAEENEAHVSVRVGEELLQQGLLGIYTVGRGASREPRLIDLQWGDEEAPKITLVGKGVCFDSGGLDMKTAAGMRQMKKDMGGAAHALGLARLIMQAKLPVRLRLLISAVENSVDGASYHPGDVIITRAGISVEIDNTDAEGRVVMCDALTEAMDDQPEYLIDFATLTGAARVALGTDIAAMFSNNEEFAEEILASSRDQEDPIWQLPLYQPYKEFLKSDIADISNCSRVGYGGAITAALYLQRFVSEETRWMHFDILASNIENRPGRPKGGEAQAIRAVFKFLQDKFSV